MQKRIALLAILIALPLAAQRTQKPPLHGAHWMAITGKPLAATAGAMMFQKGGNAVDAAAAMLAADVHDVGHALAGAARRRRSSTIRTRRRSSASTPSASRRPAPPPEFYSRKGYSYPPEYGPLAAVTPGTPGGLMAMLAEYGKLSLKDVLGAGHPDGGRLSRSRRSSRTPSSAQKSWIKQWQYSRAVMLPHSRAQPARGPRRSPTAAASRRRMTW